MSIDTPLWVCSLCTWLTVAFTLDYYGLRSLQRNHAHLFVLVAFTLDCYGLRALQRNHTHLFVLIVFTLDCCGLRALQRNHAHLFVLIVFTLDCCELKPFQLNHAHLFVLIAFELFVLNCAFRVILSMFRFVELLDKFCVLGLLQFTICRLVG